MNSKLLLRIAALLIIVHMLGHVMGHLTWDKPEDPKMGEVVTAMKSYRAEFMGAQKSMADYYQGYSLMIFGIFGVSVALLWMTSCFVTTDRAIARKMMLPVGFAFLFFGNSRRQTQRTTIRTGARCPGGLGRILRQMPRHRGILL